MKKAYKIISVAVIILLIAGCFVVVGKPPHKDHPRKNKNPPPDPEVVIVWHGIQFGGCLILGGTEEPVEENVTWYSGTFGGSAIVSSPEAGEWSDWSAWWVIEAIPEMPVPDIEIELMDGWNLISIPLNYSINISSVCIVFNNETYTWDEASDNQMVLLFLYSWDADNQMYELTDQFEPGMGYWFYSFNDCILVVG